MTRLYISGPVTGIEDDNREAFKEARRKLWHERKGYMKAVAEACGIHVKTVEEWIDEATDER